MAFSIFIHDGFTLDGDLPEDQGYPGLQFRYRPCVGPEQDEYHRESAVDPAAATCKLILGHVLNQTFTIVEGGKAGEPFVMVEKQLKTLDPYYWNGIRSLVLGYKRPAAGAEKNSPGASG